MPHFKATTSGQDMVIGLSIQKKTEKIEETLTNVRTAFSLCIAARPENAALKALVPSFCEGLDRARPALLSGDFSTTAEVFARTAAGMRAAGGDIADKVLGEVLQNVLLQPARAELEAAAAQISRAAALLAQKPPGLLS